MSKTTKKKKYSDCLELDVMDLLIEYGVPDSELALDITSMINDKINKQNEGRDSHERR